MNASTNSPMSSNHWVVVTPPQENANQAAKNTEKPAHPMSTIKRRRLLAMGWFGRLLGSTQIRSPTCPFPSPSCGGGPGWGPNLAPGFPHGDGDLLHLAGSDDLDSLGGPDLDLAQPGVQILQVAGHGAVQGHHGVALHQTGLIGRALRLDCDDQQPAVLVDPSFYRVREGLLLRPECEVGSLDPAVGPEAFHHTLGDVHRDRPAVATTKDPAVHAHRPSVRVDQRTSAESGIQWCVCLDQMLDLAPTPPAPRRRHGADGAEGRLKAPGTANGENDLPGLEVRHFCPRHGRRR